MFPVKRNQGSFKKAVGSKAEAGETSSFGHLTPKVRKYWRNDKDMSKWHWAK